MGLFHDLSTGRSWRDKCGAGGVRVYHASDVTGTGPSVSLGEFAQGKNPPAVVMTQVPRPARPPVAPSTPGVPPVRPQVAGLAPRRRIVTLTRREFSQLLIQATMQDVPKPPDTLSEVLRLQQVQGKR